MPRTRVFKSGNSQAVRIPAELAYADLTLELKIMRMGDVITIFPARHSLKDAVAILRDLPRPAEIEEQRAGQAGALEAGHRHQHLGRDSVGHGRRIQRPSLLRAGGAGLSHHLARADRSDGFCTALAAQATRTRSPGCRPSLAAALTLLPAISRWPELFQSRPHSPSIWL